MENSMSKVKIIGLGLAALTLLSGVGYLKIQKYERRYDRLMGNNEPTHEEEIKFNAIQMEAMTEKEQIQAKQYGLTKNLSAAPVITDFSKMKSVYALLGIAANKKATGSDLQNVFETSTQMVKEGKMTEKDLSKIQFSLSRHANITPELLSTLGIKSDENKIASTLPIKSKNAPDPLQVTQQKL